MWITVALGLLSKIPGTMLSMFTGINFGAIFSGIGSFLAKYWKECLVALLVLANVFTYHEWQVTSAKLVQEKAAHSHDISDFKSAQQVANANAIAEQKALEKESKADAAQADANYTTLLAQYHANLLRFSAGQSGTQQTNNHQLSTTQGSNGPSPGTDLPFKITISGDDAQVCAINTARLQAVHDWAIALPKEVTP